MNKVELIGRLTKDPESKGSQSENATAVTRYTLAVDRRNRSKSQEEQTADFISIVAFGNSADFASKYFKKGLKVAVTGRIQTGSYTNKDGVRVYTTDVVAEDQEFVESKSGNAETEGSVNIPEDEELPFK
jgi:single-strand DNA-binding protein